jgi:hypothetical protein
LNELVSFLRDGAAMVNMHREITAIFLACVFVNNFVRGRWKWSEMPGWARTVALLTDIPSLSFWAFAHRLGIDRPSYDVVSAAVALDAVKREADK